MGSIQASLNQLVLSTIGAVGGVAHGVKGTFNKPVKPAAAAEQPKTEQPKTEQPKAETTSGMGNIAKVGKNKSRTHIGAYEAAARAVYSGNDAISQKAVSKYNPISMRLEQLKAASSLRVSEEKKGGSK